jgi:acetylornithine deacetylase/succinyl-diaminopimelate desuccinylase-like protein
VGVERPLWTKDPFGATIANGRLFGRGAMDFKGGLAAFTVAAMRLAREGGPRTRDLILLSEADEEGGSYGTTWLAEHHWDKIDASESINEGGWIFAGGRGGARLMGITTIDKNSLSVTFRTRGTSTHSSRPLADSALRRLVRALNRVERYDTAPRVTPTARTYLRAWARASSGRTARRLRAITRTRRPAALRRLANQLQAGPWGELYDGLVRNIFVPTIVTGGFRANVLPGSAEATVNMRMLPGQRPRPLIAELRRAVDDPKVTITPIVTGDATVKETLDRFDERARQAPSPTNTDLFRSLVREGKRQWPGVEVAPALFEAGTDATPWRSRGIPVYGIYPYPITHADLKAMHGNDERVPIRGLEQGTDMLTRVLGDAVR